MTFRVGLYIALCFLFTFILHAQSHRNFDVSMSVGDLAQAYGRWEMAHRGPHTGIEKILVPMLEIYSPNGALIYHGTQSDTGRAQQVLRSLPAVPSPPPSPEVKMSLSEILEMTPALAKWKSTILSGHHFVVFSLSMQGHWNKPNAYSEQNHAVDTIPRRPGVNIDVVRINLTFPQN